MGHRRDERLPVASAGSQGNSQALDNGNTFVGWGQTGRFSEFDPSGNLLFDASVPAGFDTYRAYRHVWHARPTGAPVATAQRNADGTTTVHAIWNGATEVARWIVVGGPHPRALRRLGTAAWNGLDTTITLKAAADQLAVVAEDDAGREIDRSGVVAVSGDYDRRCLGAGPPAAGLGPSGLGLLGCPSPESRVPEALRPLRGGRAHSPIDARWRVWKGTAPRPP